MACAFIHDDPPRRSSCTNKSHTCILDIAAQEASELFDAELSTKAERYVCLRSGLQSYHRKHQKKMYPWRSGKLVKGSRGGVITGKLRAMKTALTNKNRAVYTENVCSIYAEALMLQMVHRLDPQCKYLVKAKHTQLHLYTEPKFGLRACALEMESMSNYPGAIRLVDYIRTSCEQKHDIWSIILLVLDAIEDLFDSTGLLHGDLSWSNIFVVPDKERFRIKFVDFGWSRICLSKAPTSGIGKYMQADVIDCVTLESVLTGYSMGSLLCGHSSLFTRKLEIDREVAIFLCNYTCLWTHYETAGHNLNPTYSPFGDQPISPQYGSIAERSFKRALTKKNTSPHSNYELLFEKEFICNLEDALESNPQFSLAGARQIATAALAA